MNTHEISQQLTELQEELASLRAAESHIQHQIDALIAGLNAQLDKPEDLLSNGDLADLPDMLRKFEAEHPALTESINRILITLGNMGI